MSLTVLLLVFPGVNTLDVNGPLEVLCNWGIREGNRSTPLPAPPFNIHVAAKSKDAIKAYEFIQLAPDKTFKEATDMINRNEVDVLIVPGYANDVGEKLIKNKDKKDDIFEPMRAFFNSPNSDGKKRWLISICVGAVLCNAIGIFDGRLATTHWGSLLSLLPDKSQKAKWVESRWVDGGTTSNNIRILSSGGISCGIDAMLWFVSQVLKPKDPTKTPYVYQIARVMDYEWNGGPQSPFKTTEQDPDPAQTWENNHPK